MIKEKVSYEEVEKNIAQLSAQLNQRKEELAVISSVQEALSKKMDTQGIYDLVGNRIRDLFNAQVVGISTIDLEEGTEKFQYMVEKGERCYAEGRPLDKLRIHLIETRKKIIINNREEGIRWFGSEVIPGTEPIKSAVFVPLVIDDKVTSYITLQNIDKEYAFSDDDIRLLETLASSMSVALENARLFDETNRLLKETEQGKAELAVINSVQEGLVKEIDLQGIYKLLGNRIRELFNAQVVSIGTFDLTNKLEYFNYYIEKGEVSLPQPRPFDKVRQHLIQTGQNILINENVTKAVAEFGMKVLPGTEMPKSVLFMPMKVGDKVTGYVSLQNIDEEHAFSFSDVRLLSTLSNSMSVALQNAKLFDQTTRLLKETEQRNAELAVINSVQESLVAQMDMRAIYDLVGEKIREIFKVQVIDIVTYDRAKNLIEDQYAFEKGDRSLIGAREPIGFRKHVIRTKQLFLVNRDFEKISQDFGNTVIIGEAPKSFVLVPMIAGGEVTGLISLQNVDHENAFSDSDVTLLSTLANSMSVALESARLFDETNRLLKETEQRTSELAVINSVQEGLVAQMDLHAIYDLVGEKIRRIFNAQIVDIVTYDKTKNLIEDRYAFENGDRSMLGPREPKGFRKYVIQSKQVLLMNDNIEKHMKEYDNEVLIGDMTKSNLFVPLILRGEVNGIISLQNVDEENAFSDSDVSLLTTLANSMSVALESASLFHETNRLLKETEQRTAELAVINSVQQGLAKELDMHAIYELVGEKIRQIFNAQVIDIVTYDNITNLLQDRYAYEKGDRTLVGTWEPTGFRKHVIDAGEVLVINSDVENKSQEYDSKILHGEISKSLVFVPLMSGNEVKGMISLQDLDKENAFSESDIRLLTTLSNSMTVALENARLFDETNRLLKETEQRTAELAVINSVQEGLAHELDIQGIYDLVGDRVQRLFDAQVVIIATFDLHNKNEHFNYFIEDYVKIKAEARPIGNVRERLILEKHTIYIKTEEETIKEFGPSVIGDTKMTKSLLFVPLMAGSEIRGYVSLQNSEIEHAFSESDVRLLETLANSMSIALENARLFDETNRLLKETEQRTAELAIINGVQDGLATKLDKQSIYDLVGDKISNVFDTQGIAISSYDRQTNYITHPYYLFKGKRLNEPPFKLGRGLASHIIQNGQPLLINEKAADRYKELGAVFASSESEDAAKSWLGVPLISGGQVNGTIRLENYDHEFAYTDSDVSLLQTLANSMGVALENARLFDETTHLLAEAKQRAAELSTVNNISKALASQLDADELIQYVGDQMRQLFNANIVYLALLNPKTRMINFAYQYGEIMLSRMIGEGLTSKIIMSGEALLINKDLAVTTEEMGIQRMGVDAASYLGVPIPVGDEIVGVLSVQSTEQENRFNENDLRLLSTIAASVGVALNNAALFEDVKLAKMEAEASSKAAEKANEAKSAFLSTVSHELRTPLTSVLGFAKIIRKRLDEKIFPSINRSDPKTDKVVNQITENLQVVISEGERLTHLINDVLDLAKIEAGKMEWNVEDVSLSEVAERAISATSSLFDQKSLKLEKQIENDLPAIKGDRDKLIQVIINLISNAVKFTDEGLITLKVARKKNELVVDISDTGIGIAHEDFAAVFEQFKQVGGDTLTDKPKGTGLGLPICKEIVEHHGGRIWLESKPGKGSTFSFALPFTKEEVPTKPVDLENFVKQLKDQMAQSNFNGMGKNANILVVDDDDSIRNLLHQELSEAGYFIDEASNGKQALDAVRNKKPDLIILDIMMPEMNGFDVAAILKNDPQTMDIPIIVLSIVQDKLRGFRIGVDRYLTKPIDTVQLFSEVGSLLEQGKSKKKVMVVDEDSAAIKTLTDVLDAKGYQVVESNGKELLEKAISSQPDIIILNSLHSDKQEVIQTLRFEKGLENVLFLIYQ